MKRKIVNFLNSLFPIVIASIIMGAYYIQFTKHEDPCPLCMLQRLAMIGVAIGPLLNLRFGISTIHYSISLFSAILGGAVSLRQICLHICPGSPSFGEPVLGLSLYTWAFLAFATSIFMIGVLLLLHKPSKEDLQPKKVGELGIVAFALIFIAAFADIITTFQHCGFGTCPD